MLRVGEREKVILLTKAAIVQRTPDGRLGVVISGSPTDPAMGGEAYAAAARWSGDARIQDAVNGLLEWIRLKAPRSNGGISRIRWPRDVVRRIQLRAAISRSNGLCR